MINIQAIVFDAVGTLIHVNPSVENVYAEVGRRFGSKLDPVEIRQRFRSAFGRQERVDEAAGWRTSESRERERWKAIVAQVLDDVADADACFESLYAAFARPEVWTFDADWPALSAELARRNILQVVASNFDQRLNVILRQMPESDRVNHIIVSSQVGWRKPAPEFFARLIATMQLQAGEILFIGDDVANDFEPAQKAGMEAILFDPLERHSAERLRVGRLDEILDFL